MANDDKDEVTTDPNEEYVAPRVTRAMFDAMTPEEQAQVFAPTGELGLMTFVIDGQAMTRDEAIEYNAQRQTRDKAAHDAMLQSYAEEDAIRAAAKRQSAAD